jgi:hypothetical protein
MDWPPEQLWSVCSGARWPKRKRVMRAAVDYPESRAVRRGARSLTTIKKPAHYPSAGNCPWGSPLDGLTYTVDLDSEKRLMRRKGVKKPARGAHRQ